MLKGAGKLLTKAKNAVVNFAKNTARAVVNVAKKAYNIGRNIVNTVVNTAKGVVNWAGTQINNAKNWAVQQWNNYQAAPSYQASSGSYGGGYHSPSSSHAYAQQQQAQARAQAEQRRQQHIRDEYSQSTGIKTTPKTREAKSMFRNWGKALKEMYTHVCKTAKRVKKQVANYVKKIDWKKVAVTAGAIGVGIALTVATAGAAAPVIAGMVGTAGLSGLGAAVVTGVAVGAVSGAAGGAVNAFTTSVLSGDKPVTILKNTFTGMVNGAVTGGATGGLLGVAGSATSSVANPVARHVVDTAGETVVDTIVDASQGGQVTPASIATSLAINALSEGIPTRGAKGVKADVPKNKPRAGDVSIRKSPKDVTPVQQLALPGPNSNALRLEAPSTKTSQINPYDIRFSQSSVNGADAIQSSMVTNGWKGGAIDVVKMPDGQLTTIDNTRVIAARGAGIDVTARVHQYTDSLPDEFIDRFTTRTGTPSTWGDAVQLRVGKQKSSFRTENPYGSYNLERRN